MVFFHRQAHRGTVQYPIIASSPGPFPVFQRETLKNWEWAWGRTVNMAAGKQPGVLPVHGHVQQQGASAGRLGTFTGSSQDFYKKQGTTMSSGVGKPVTRWRPTAFDFKSGSSTTCPTCQGTGRIPKGTCVRCGRESSQAYHERTSILICFTIDLYSMVLHLSPPPPPPPPPKSKYMTLCKASSTTSV